METVATFEAASPSLALKKNESDDLVTTDPGIIAYAGMHRTRNKSITENRIEVTFEQINIKYLSNLPGNINE
jgi:hypothetical protein